MSEQKWMCILCCGFILSNVDVCQPLFHALSIALLTLYTSDLLFQQQKSSLV